MAPLAGAHHHRNTTKVSHKPFKSRHATKGLLKDLSKGKIDHERINGHRKNRHQQVMSKIERRHQARQVQQRKHREHNEALSVFSGANRAPRIVAVVPLTQDVDARAVIQKLNAALDIEVPDGQCSIEVEIERFRQSVQFLPVRRELFEALDACRVADYVVFVLSSTEEVDEYGQLLLKSIESQGISNTLSIVHALDAIEPPKKRAQVLASLKSFISHFFPNEKVHNLDANQECVNVIRALCTSTPKGVRWRDDRSWMVVDDVQWSGEEGSELASCVLTGVVRGKPLKADRLLQVADLGAFQIDRITAVPTQHNKKRKSEEMVTDDTAIPEILDQATADQDDLAEFAPEEIVMEDMEDMDDGIASQVPTERRKVLLDDHHYFDEEPDLPTKPKRLPRGTSQYQSAWILDDMSDSGSDWEDQVDKDGDVDMEAVALPQDGIEGLDKATQRDPTEGAPSEYPQSEMFLDQNPSDEVEQIEAFRSRKRDEHEDLEYPDEIELQPNVLARERLSKYRGLKSLRSSTWATEEDRPHEPENWNRLLQIPNYKAARSQALRATLIDGVKPGTKVHIHLRGSAPTSLKQHSKSSPPLTAFSLHIHEHKQVAMNFSITMSSDSTSPIKSKDEIIVQCGPRRHLIRPVFSNSGSTPNDVHKFDRYLHPGRSATATFTGPLTWGGVPALFFRRAPTNENPNALELIGTGTSGAPSSTRVIAKRIILTGHPFKIHKKIVTIRYMFFNSEDVSFFQALQLWTIRGRSGFIKESLGTHGYFKATFDAKINPQDSVGVSLYKRVFPRPSIAWSPSELKERGEEVMEEIEME